MPRARVPAIPARSASVSPSAAVDARWRAARSAANCTRGRRQRVRRGERFCARQQAGRRGHGAQSLLEHMTPIRSLPAGLGRWSQLLLVCPVGQIACSCSQSRWQASSAQTVPARACHWSSARAGPRRMLAWSSRAATICGASRSPGYCQDNRSASREAGCAILGT